MKRLGVWALLWPLLAHPAGDVAATGSVPLPGLESDPAGTVFVEAAAVSLIEDRVTVTLEVKSGEQSPALLITGEPFGWTGASGIYADRQFPELAIRIDGEPSAPSDRFEAFSGATNITNMLISVHMDPWAVTHTPPLVSAQVRSVPVLTAMKNVGAIKNAADPASNDYLAKWTIRRLLRIPLKADSEQRVDFIYTARPGHSVVAAADLITSRRERTYCLSSTSLSRFLHRAGTETFPLSVDEYDVPLGIDGTPPSSVVLTLQSGPRARERIFWCGPHGQPVAKSGSVTAERAGVDDRGALHVLRIAQVSP